MILVLGHLVVAADECDAHLALSHDAVRTARAAPGCRHFAVTADPLEPTWVDVAELWAGRDELDAYRNSPGEDDADPFTYVREFHVEEHEVSAAPPATV